MMIFNNNTEKKTYAKKLRVTLDCISKGIVKKASKFTEIICKL